LVIYLDMYQTLALNKGKPRLSHIIHSLCKINACTPMTAWFNFLLSFSVARCHGHQWRAVVILAATIWTSAALSMKLTAPKSHDLIKSLFCLQTGWHCAMIKRSNVFIAYLQFQGETPLTIYVRHTIRSVILTKQTILKWLKNACERNTLDSRMLLACGPQKAIALDRMAS